MPSSHLSRLLRTSASLLVLASTLLLASCGGGGSAGAGSASSGAQAGCSGSGTLTLTLSPCPLSLSLISGQQKQFEISGSVEGTVTTFVFVVVVDTAGVIAPDTSLRQVTGTTYVGQFLTKSGLAVGDHKGTLAVKLCADPECDTTYVSAPLTYDIDVKPPNNPVPTITWATPANLPAGSAATVLTVKGSGFNGNTKLLWDGAALTLTAQSDTLLQAELPASAITAVETAKLTVSNPAPAGGEASLSVSVVTPKPSIASLSPGFIAPGSAGFTLTVQGAHFNSHSVVDWNGTVLASTLVSATELTAAVPAADVASATVASVIVSNPTASGGSSVPASFAVAATGTAVTEVTGELNDAAWDPVNGVLYGAEPATASSNPQSVVTFDPIAASVIAAHATSNAVPIVLAVSDDSEFLYVSFDGDQTIRRFELPAMSNALVIQAGSDPALGPNYIATVQPSPISSHILAAIFVNHCCSPSNFQGGRVIVDDVPAVVGDFGDIWDDIAWSPDGTKLYASDTETSPRYFSISTIQLQTQTAEDDDRGEAVDTAMHVDPTDGRIYTDSGQILDPVQNQFAGTLPGSGVVIPDTAIGCVFMVYQTVAQTSTSNYTLACFDPSTQTSLRSIVLTSLDGFPLQLLRWGNEGLILMTSNGTYFISGQIVSGS